MWLCNRICGRRKIKKGERIIKNKSVVEWWSNLLFLSSRIINKYVNKNYRRGKRKGKRKENVGVWSSLCKAIVFAHSTTEDLDFPSCPSWRFNYNHFFLLIFISPLFMFINVFLNLFNSITPTTHSATLVNMMLYHYSFTKEKNMFSELFLFVKSFAFLIWNKQYSTFLYFWKLFFPQMVFLLHPSNDYAL